MGRLLVRSVCVFSLVWVLTAASAPAFAQQYAVGYRNTQNWGVWAYISTAVPQVRDGNGGYSFHRINVYAFQQPQEAFIRAGWIRQNILGTVTDPLVYWEHQKASGPPVEFGVWPATLQIAQPYWFQIRRDGAPGAWSSTWTIYFNSWMTPIKQVSPTFQEGENWDSGGQTSSAQNAMGVSWHTTHMWWNPATQAWRLEGGTNVYITNPVYQIFWPSSPDWQVYGNN